MMMMTTTACVSTYRLVVEIPPTSAVITTPDVLIVKLIPDASMTAMIVLACQGVVAVLIIFYSLQQFVGVSISQLPN